MKRSWMAFILASVLLLSGCGRGQDLPLKFTTVAIPAQVEEMEVSCFSGAGGESWVITQPDIDAVREWVDSLSCDAEPVEEEHSPGNLNGGITYHFSYKTAEGESGFSYMIAGEKDGYLRIGENWYRAGEPSPPPVALALEDDPWGIWMQVVSASSGGVKIVCKQAGGEITGELQTGSPYMLQMYTETGWVDLTYTTCIRIEGDWGWTMEAWLIPKNESVEWTVDWTWLCGELPDGRYRIGKEIMDFRGPGDYDERVYWAEFEITDGANELSEGETFASVRRSDSDALCILTSKDAALLRHMLEKGAWDEGAAPDCLNDCSLFFASDWDNIAYHSECGTFHDTQKQRSLTLSDEDRGIVNEVLGKYILLDQRIEIFDAQENTQAYFNAKILELGEEKIVVECVDPFESRIEKGETVLFATDIVAATGMPQVAEGNSVRIIYNAQQMEKTVPKYLPIVFNVYLLDENGNIVGE